MTTFNLIAFDADDTLWHNESLFSEAQVQFIALIQPYLGHSEGIEERLYETEVKNLTHYGYGVKAYILSLIETAIEATEGRITAGDIGKILTIGRGMLAAQVSLLPHVAEVIAALSKNHRLMIITKGDLLDQEAKVVRSGLGEYFQHVEVVSHKTPETYTALLKKHNITPADFLMVGNSLKSDILPVVAIGGQAVHIPYHTTWAHEHVDPTADERSRYFELADIRELPALIERLISKEAPHV